jgi:hypothetical protein
MAQMVALRHNYTFGEALLPQLANLSARKVCPEQHCGLNARGQFGCKLRWKRRAVQFVAGIKKPHH